MYVNDLKLIEGIVISISDSSLITINFNENKKEIIKKVLKSMKLPIEINQMGDIQFKLNLTEKQKEIFLDELEKKLEIAENKERREIQKLNETFEDFLYEADKDEINYLCERYLNFEEYKNEPLEIIYIKLSSIMKKEEIEETIEDYLLEKEEEKTKKNNIKI
jgi:hypothetical protein